MLIGRFGNTTGRPYLEGRIHLPKQNIQLDISFLIDTGADQSMLMPGDAMRGNLDFTTLASGQEIGGVSGNMNVFEAPAIVVFSEPGKKLFVYSISLSIAPNSPDLLDRPSLLGRDILDRWEMLYRPASKTLTFNVVTADVTLPLSKSAKP